jgi:hypothetical protein
VLGTLQRAVRVVIDGEAVAIPSVITGVVIGVIALQLNAPHLEIDVAAALGSMVTFLFGVLLAFSIARTRERLATIQDLITQGNASLFSIDQLIAVFGDATHDRVRSLIDRQLTEQIDYRLVDNHLSNHAHLALTSTLIDLVPQTRQEEVVYKRLTELTVEMGSNRALIEATTGQSLSGIEWTGNLLLFLLLMVLLTILPSGTPWGSAAAGFLAGTLVAMLILLRKLDLLRWHERVAIWEPTTRLFRNMDLIPYVPRVVIDTGRYRPTGTVRVVDYPDPYPDRKNKVVTVMELDGKGPTSPPG